MPEIAVVITDDWELRGNGTGSVKKMQCEPTLAVMNVYEHLGIRTTFNIEVLQQLAFESYANVYPWIAEERDLWVFMVKEMVGRGFDIQLHLHPQWIGALYDGNIWHLPGKWDISTYPKNTIDKAVRDAIDYLESIVGGFSPASFRGGSWAIGPPAGPLFEILEQAGVQFDCSIVKGIHYNTENLKVDYRNLPSPYYPYYPDYNDPRRLGTRGHGLIEIPTQSVSPAELPTHWKSILRKLTPRRVARKVRQMKHNRMAAELTVQDPFGFLSGRGAHEDYILDIANYEEQGMLNSLLEIVIERGRNAKASGILPLVLQCHSKDLDTHRIRVIRRAISYLQRKHPDIQFFTMSDLAENKSRLVEPMSAPDL